MIKHFFDFNLGFSELIPEWRKCLHLRYLKNDIFAGITVTTVAIPLSLAIALASGVNPQAGLISAIIAGIVCALFGGTPLAISGPAAAMAVLLSSIIDNVGAGGLIFLCLIAGIMQLLCGAFGFGRIARFVPIPVISGFTAGMGLIILINQLPRAVGLASSPDSHIFDVFSHLVQNHAQVNLIALFIVTLTLLISFFLSKTLLKMPAFLISLSLVTSINYFFFSNQIPTIGNMSKSLSFSPLIEMPSIPFPELLLNAFAIFLLASLETLLSSISIDKLTKGIKHNPNQELIGQGLGNIAIAFFKGIPATSLMVRSAINVESGAKTRRASIFQSLFIFLILYYAAPYIGLIPIAALAGILFSVSFSMITYKEFFSLWRSERSEALVYLTTFLVVVFFDLTSGIQVGIIAAALIFLWQATKTHLHLSISEKENIIRISLKGNLTFLSTSKIDEIETKILSQTKPSQIIVLDLSEISNLDSTGASAIIDLFNQCSHASIHFFIKGLPRRFENMFKIADGETLLNQHYLISERDIKTKLSDDSLKSFHGLLVHGVKQFYSTRREQDKRLYERIKHIQNPHTLFITCSDSRLNPSEITSSYPGELFIIRNVGNYIPAFQTTVPFSEPAALEFALNYLNITDIVICGHAECGAIKACCDTDATLSNELKAWISLIRNQLSFDKKCDLNEVAKQNVLNQIKNLNSYDIVKDRLQQGTLTIHGWFYDFEKNRVFEWSEKSNQFFPISG